MKTSVVFLLFTLISNIAMATSSSQKCSELIDKMEDMAELKKALHCQNNKMHDSANNTNKLKLQGKTTELPSGQTSTKPTSSVPPLVKKSKNSICHGKGTKYYKQTKRFTGFDTMQTCLDSGGRLPRG